MKLRDHSHMRFDGVSNWPPPWTVMGPGHSVLKGEFGVLTDAYTNGIGSNICFLVMEVDGERYLGALLFDDRAFCQRILALLQLNIGRSIRKIGDLNLQSSETENSEISY